MIGLSTTSVLIDSYASAVKKKMNEQYKERRKEFETSFKRYSEIVGSGQEYTSPSGRYKLETSMYGNGQEICWNYSRGIVTEIESGRILANIKRNLGHFLHTWIEHPNGNEYLLCGEDYQGYSVVNLTKERYQVYFPEEGHQGFGFCWATPYPSPDKLMLAVDGCVWAAPYEIVFYDFQKPNVCLT